MPNYKDGEVVGHRRWCATHERFHADLFPCEEYPTYILEKISISNIAYIANLRSRKWCDAQKEKSGISEEGIEIFRAMSGIEENDWTD